MEPPHTDSTFPPTRGSAGSIPAPDRDKRAE